MTRFLACSLLPLALFCLSQQERVAGFLLQSPRSRFERSRLNSIQRATAETGNRVWKSVLQVSEIAPGQTIPVTVGGLNLLVTADKDGSIVCVSNNSPVLKTPMEGGKIVEGTISDPYSGTKFDLETGAVVGTWCPQPPVIGKVIGLIQPQRPLRTYPVRQVGQTLQVLVANQQVFKQSEKQYWKGLLDAQGKDDDTYY
mmetsp:Transcript_41244/g.81346  ORF Transcript_41244/g.81346 Transcript_41244/m.81346 type:complete len:199 (-) Transcript_41244:1274-1870(-)